MKKTFFLLAIIAFFSITLSAQTIVGGAGNCAVNGNPNSVLNLKTINQKYDCAFVIDTITGDQWVYKVSLLEGSRWENRTQIVKDSQNQQWRLGGNVLTGNTVLGTNSDHDLIFVRNGVRSGLLNNTLSNTSFGVSALYSNTTGVSNTANGVNSLFNNSSGNSNTASGLQSLYSNTTGGGNTALGVNSLYLNDIGAQNTAIGVSSLFANRSGNNNTSLGFAALANNTTGSNNTAIGYSANVTASSNTIVIGSNVTSSTSNQTVIGNTSTSSVIITGIQNLSTPDSVVTIKGSTLKRTSLADLGLDRIKASNLSVTIPTITGMTVGTPISVTVAGVAIGNQVSVTPITDLFAAGFSLPQVRVTAANTLEFRFYGQTSLANNGITALFSVTIQK
jgi:hypothetical protein